MQQRNLLLFALGSLIILLVWGRLFPPRRAPEDAVPAAVETVVAPAGANGEAIDDDEAAAGEPAEEEMPEEEVSGRETIAADREEVVEVRNDAVIARFTNRGGQLQSFQLAGLSGREAAEVDLVRRRTAPPFPFALVDPNGNSLEINRALFRVERLVDGDATGLRLLHQSPRWRVEKRFQLLPDGRFRLDLEVEGIADWGVLVGPGLRNPTTRELESRYFVRHASASFRGELEQWRTSKVAETSTLVGDGMDWVALEDTYFITAMVPSTPIDRLVLRPYLYAVEGEQGEASFQPRPPDDEMTEGLDKLPQELALVLDPAGGQASFEGYWRTKSYTELVELPYSIERTVRWGSLGFLAKPLLFGLVWIHDNVVQNYGWSIVILTAAIMLLLFPLTHKSQVSMERMQQLKPQMDAIRAKYQGKKRDKQGRPNLESQRKMNEEMQTLFRQEGVNPASGCFPILLQMPVFFAFYSLLGNSVELWKAPWMGWIHDLSAPDPIYVLPIIMGSAQFLQQRMMPVTASTQPSQRFMMQLMPFFFMFIAFGFASGLVLYWLTQTIFRMLQQVGYHRLKKAGYLGGVRSEEKVEPTKPSRRSRSKT